MNNDKVKELVGPHKFPLWAYGPVSGEVTRRKQATGETAHCVSCNASLDEVLDYGVGCTGDAMRGSTRPLGI